MKFDCTLIELWLYFDVLWLFFDLSYSQHRIINIRSKYNQSIIKCNPYRVSLGGGTPPIGVGLGGGTPPPTPAICYLHYEIKVQSKYNQSTIKRQSKYIQRTIKWNLIVLWLYFDVLWLLFDLSYSQHRIVNIISKYNQSTIKVQSNVIWLYFECILIVFWLYFDCTLIVLWSHDEDTYWLG